MAQRKSKVENALYHHCFTYWEPTVTPEKLLHSFKLANATYVIFGEEIGPVSGKLHYQGYVQWARKIRATTLSKHFKGVYFKPSDGSPLSNMTYCSKDGKVWTYGEPKPTAQQAAGAAQQEIWHDIKELAKQRKYGQIYEKYPSQMIRYGNSIMNSHKYIDVPDVPERCETQVYWYYGKTGCGKSHGIREILPSNHYKKRKTKYWDNYLYQEHVYIEELSDKDECIVNELKEWLDVWNFPAEFKHGAIPVDIRPKAIYITSNYSIEEIFNPIDAECIRRRCTVIKKFISRDNVITEKDARPQVCQEGCPQSPPCSPIQAQDAPSPVS